MLALVRRHVPGLRLVAKSESPLLRRFAPGFTTVLGPYVLLYRPAAEIPRDRLAAILAHELVHQLDQQRWGPLFYVSYGVCLPAGRTVRAVWERRAYAVDLMLAHEAGGLAACERRLVTLFSDRSYVWMWAGESSARAFLAPVVTAVREGRLQQESPYAEILSAWSGREVAPREQQRGR